MYSNPDVVLGVNWERLEPNWCPSSLREKSSIHCNVSHDALLMASSFPKKMSGKYIWVVYYACSVLL